MRTLPTLRDKKRYLAFEVNSEQPITRQELAKEILNSTHSLFGDAGCSEINPSLLSFEDGCGILRCSREKTREARAALACVSSIHGIRASIFVLGISGTIKGTEKFIQQLLNRELEPKKE